MLLNVFIVIVFYFQFVVYVAQEKEEGLYTFNFHNCMNYPQSSAYSKVDMWLQVRSSDLLLVNIEAYNVCRKDFIPVLF